MNVEVVIGVSTGGAEPLRGVVAGIPNTCSSTVFVVEHMGQRQSKPPVLLALAGSLHVTFANDHDMTEPAHTYMAPLDHYMRLRHAQIGLSRSRQVHCHVVENPALLHSLWKL